MKTMEEWFELYGVSHQNKTNIIIHKVCVPLIMFSILGILWSLPFPIDKEGGNWAIVFCFIASFFYLTLSLKVYVFMLFQSAAMLALAFYIEQTTQSLLSLSILIFVLAWIGQFIGHKIEGKKPSFFDDLKFLLIGPVWVYPFFKKA